MRIILASASPRRRQILQDAGFDFNVLSLDVEESFPAGLDALQVPAFLASKKMFAAKHHVRDNDAMIITADTVVILQDEIIGKPESETDAENILRKLSGNMHTVITAVCIFHNGEEILIESATKVFFAPLSNEEITQYIEQYKPLDKAGAYAIQEWIGLNKILRIEGDYYNVVGFPMSKVYPYLKDALLKETH